MTIRGITFAMMLASLVWGEVSIASFGIGDAANTQIFKDTMAQCFIDWSSLDSLDKSGIFKEKHTGIIDTINDILGATVGKDRYVEKRNKDVVSLAEFVFSVYQKVPYHNVCHGIMVAYYTTLFLQGQPLDDEIKKAIIFGALMHDIGHNGYTNQYCSKAGEGKKFCKTVGKTGSNKCEADFGTKSEAVKAYLQKHQESDKSSLHHILPADSTGYLAVVEEVMKIFTDVFYGKKAGNLLNDPESSIFFHELLCGTAEIHHAVIAMKSLENLRKVKPESPIDKPDYVKAEVTDEFKKHSVLTVLFTTMALYDFGTGAPKYQYKVTPKPNISWYALTHMADILAPGDDHENLRRVSAEMVNKEFRVENFLKASNEEKKPDQKDEAQKQSPLVILLKGQKDFIQIFVQSHVRNLFQNLNSELDHYYTNSEFWCMVARAVGVNYDKMIEHAGDQTKQSMIAADRVFKGFNEDNEKIIAFEAKAFLRV